MGEFIRKIIQDSGNYSVKTSFILVIGYNLLNN